jgi:hypothetical protein
MHFLMIKCSYNVTDYLFLSYMMCNCQRHKEPQEQRLRKSLNLTFKQGTKQNYVIQK